MLRAVPFEVAMEITPQFPRAVCGLDPKIEHALQHPVEGAVVPPDAFAGALPGVACGEEFHHAHEYAVWGRTSGGIGRRDAAGLRSKV
jgi:hypothetical protein